LWKFKKDNISGRFSEEYVTRMMTTVSYCIM